MSVARGNSKAVACAVVWLTAALLGGIALLSAQVPWQAPGQPPPPIHIPHIGGSRQERPEPEAQAPAPTEGQVYVVLWFDTEDYILPQSDDAAKRIAVFLTQQGVQGTFKVVGEKARVLKQRQRQDVISALAQHDIGFHSNTHSQHPTVAEYESNLDWATGIEEFARRERPGLESVEQVFKRTSLSAYGQPGVSWAPQAFPVLAKWGVRVYLDEGKQVGYRGQPFYYGGLLNIFNTRVGDQLRPDENWSNLDAVKARFQEAYVTMTDRKQGGLVSICFHPCEFVHKEFWDAVNFSDGANPPRAQWKLPPMKTPEETEKAFQFFEELVRFLKSFPRVQFLTASTAAQTFRDLAQTHVFSEQEIGTIAGQVSTDVSFQNVGNFNLSAGDVFCLLNRYVAGMIARNASEPLVLQRDLQGPSAGVAALTSKLVAPWDQVSRSIMDVQDELDKTGRIPNAIWLGSQFVPPESYLVGIAQTAQALVQNAQPPDSVTFPPARLAAADYVANDSPNLWDWVIFPHGFDAPKLMSLAKLQAWTLKPASK